MKRPALVVDDDPVGCVRPLEVGEAFLLDEHAEGITLGRVRGELRVEQSHVQRRMCRVRLDEGGAPVLDRVNDRGGIFLNGEAAATGWETRHPLHDGDTITFPGRAGRTARFRFEWQDEDPFSRVARLGRYVVFDGRARGGPARRRAFLPGAPAFFRVVSGPATPGDPDQLAGERAAFPVLVDRFESDGLVHRVFPDDGGVSIQRLLVVPGEVDASIAARILVDARRALALSFDFEGEQRDLADLRISWLGRVVFMPPRALPRVLSVEPTSDGEDGSGAPLAALLSWLAPDHERDREHFNEQAPLSVVEEAVRRFVTSVGRVASDHELATFVRALFPHEHARDAELLEQVELLQDTDVEKRAKRGLAAGS